MRRLYWAFVAVIFALGGTHPKVVFASSYAPSCFVLGDSIAQGIASHLPQCRSDTKVGLNTKDALSRFSQVPAVTTAVISLGINDGAISTRSNLAAIRNRLSAPNVIWILPSHTDKKLIVQALARAHGDTAINVDKFISADGIHPTGKGYKLIASNINIE